MTNVQEENNLNFDVKQNILNRPIPVNLSLCVRSLDRKLKYDETLESVKDFTTMAELFNTFAYIKRPNQLKASKKLDLTLFKKGIKPCWEDEKNKNGLRYCMTLDERMIDEVWDHVVLMFAGNSMDYMNLYVNGVVLGVRNQTFKIWFWLNTIPDLSDDDFFRQHVERIVGYDNTNFKRVYHDMQL